MPGFKLSRRHVVVALSLIALFLVGVFAWQAYTASRSLMAARDHAETVQKRIKAGDFDGATFTGPSPIKGSFTCG